MEGALTCRWIIPGRYIRFREIFQYELYCFVKIQSEIQNQSAEGFKASRNRVHIICSVSAQVNYRLGPLQNFIKYENVFNTTVINYILRYIKHLKIPP